MLLSCCVACAPSAPSAPSAPNAGTSAGGEAGVEAGVEAGGEAGAGAGASPAPCRPLDAPSDAGLTPHFARWLEERGGGALARADLAGGSFGGKVSDDDCVTREPVLFVHGNSDRALGGPLGGWAEALAAFRAAGYRSAELYATTYGPADPAAALSASYLHSIDNIRQVRHMIERTLEHTGAARLDVIAHSLGVTLTRRALLGGVITEGDATYDLGAPLTDRVDTFVAIAGAHLGLAGCYFSSEPVCSADLGLYPGRLEGGRVTGRARILEELNAAEGYEGAHRYSLWSAADEVIQGACLVWGQNTCLLPAHTAERRYEDLRHMELRDRTAELQVRLVTLHSLEGE